MVYTDTSTNHYEAVDGDLLPRPLAVKSKQDPTFTPQFDFVNLIPGIAYCHDNDESRPSSRDSVTTELWEDDVQQTQTNDARVRRRQKLEGTHEYLKIWETFSGVHQAEWDTIDPNTELFEEPFTSNHDVPALTLGPVQPMPTIEGLAKDLELTMECPSEAIHKSHGRGKPSQYTIFPKQPTSTHMAPPTKSTVAPQTFPDPPDLPPRRLNGRTKSYPNIASKLMVTDVPPVTPLSIAATSLETWEQPRTPPVPKRRSLLPLGGSKSNSEMRRAARQQRASYCPPTTMARTASRSEHTLPLPLEVDHITSVFESDSDTENGDYQSMFQNHMRKLRTKMARRKSHYGEEDTKKDRSSYGSENTVPVLKFSVANVAADKSAFKRKRSSLDFEDLWYKSKRRITSIIVLYKRSER
ncbi:hypothetical protein PFICI_02265 [Pestalotiopsis fici W106-1]|uniref:Uncharacterized protein n=1 Tax=Pestalotiopsis fici (strain W106-1 / CGMCC3.15140) TaxID=1229662 RepID=W3XDX9_PESFW|nr:uncharacterized protein PFICI_02265 [Pestalotiopsis fici W106-1]ETS84240.1 hypothetical protein PFICI_02265 [Pestalotiopsis fici W106-1]